MIIVVAITYVCKKCKNKTHFIQPTKIGGQKPYVVPSNLKSGEGVDVHGHIWLTSRHFLLIYSFVYYMSYTLYKKA